jgi:hypothetical protein
MTQKQPETASYSADAKAAKPRQDIRDPKENLKILAFFSPLGVLAVFFDRTKRVESASRRKASMAFH